MVVHLSYGVFIVVLCFFFGFQRHKFLQDIHKLNDIIYKKEIGSIDKRLLKLLIKFIDVEHISFFDDIFFKILTLHPNNLYRVDEDEFLNFYELDSLFCHHFDNKESIERFIKEYLEAKQKEEKIQETPLNNFLKKYNIN